MRLAQEGIRLLQDTVDTLIVIPNQNLFRLVDKQTPLLEAFRFVVLPAGTHLYAHMLACLLWLADGLADCRAVGVGM